MNEKIYKILEFPKIRERLMEHAQTALGKKEVEKLKVETSLANVQKNLDETEEGLQILRLRQGMPITPVADITPHMKRLQIGANLNGLELAQVAKVLRIASEVARFFEDLQELEIELPQLYHWESNLTHYPSINAALRRAIAEDGEIYDEASDELANLRRLIKKGESEIRATLTEATRGKKAKYLSDTIITMRNGRFVLPVKQEYKNLFGGIVHDQSASGQTLFIEPKNVVELNNRLRTHQMAERAEIERILAELSALLAPVCTMILNNARIIAHLDFVEAKARLAKSMKATIPRLNQTGNVALYQARHPLIDEEKIVPNDLYIGDTYKIIVITGPNTGGKTITLKTLGLLQMMVQAGLAIPVKEASETILFTEIFADIGDEQSIEQSLSTFSSHMTNIVEILRKVDAHSLVLFDELGAGTDPQEGATLAIALLDELGKKGSYTLASTHYPELKVYGYHQKGVINASMEFDVETLRPTYRLMIGVPGRSNAFEIAHKLGLPQDIIQNAKNTMNTESQGMNEMIADLENRQKMAEMEYFEARKNVEDSEEFLTELQQMYHFLEKERENLLEKARKEANTIIKTAEDESEKLIANLRNLQERAEISGIKEHEIIENRSKIEKLYHDETLQKNKVLQKAKKARQFKVGDEVMVAEYGQRASLLSRNKDGSWAVQIGILKMNVNEEALTLLAKEKPTKANLTRIKSDSGARSSVSSQLDVRGERYEDALVRVASYLDTALLAGYPQVTIVHGKGTGALRSGIKELLQTHRNVKSFSFAPANAGGNGATIVEFH